jgi:hypothetical protein
MKRIFAIGKMGPAFREERRVDVTEYDKFGEAFDKAISVLISIMLALVLVCVAVIGMALLDAWIMRGRLF